MATPRCIYHERQTPINEGKADAQRRLKREQRLEAFEMRRLRIKSDLLKTKDWTKGAANEEAWARALAEYPPLSEEELNALEIREKPLKVEPWSPPIVTVEKQVAKLPKMLTAVDINEAFLWVLNHPALVRPGIGPNRTQYVVNDDFDNDGDRCPSKGAWSILYLALKDVAAFRKEVMAFLAKQKSAPGEGDGGGDEVDDDLGDLEAMLAGVK